MPSITVDFASIIAINNEQFEQLCSRNRDLQFERTAKGELIIMSPTGGGTGKRNLTILGELYLWNRQQQLGVVFDSSTGFILPNAAIRSPDAAWIPREKWQQLSFEQQEKFIPLCPDFVIELRSKSDRLKSIQEKMSEYIANGTRLGWLINRQDRTVEIYREGREKELLSDPYELSGEYVLEDFVLNMESIW